jgi:hypothetical protein
MERAHPVDQLVAATLEEVPTMPRRRSARSKSSPDPHTFIEKLPDSFTCEFEELDEKKPGSKTGFKLTKPASHKGRRLEEFLNQDLNPALSADRLILVQDELRDKKDHDDPREFECKNVVNRKAGSPAQPQDWLCEYEHDGDDVPFILSEVVSVDLLDDKDQPVGESRFFPPRHYT